ncbi:MAG: selenium-binding protein SBP56-related protein [Longimicrobiales bacterium]|nr:selenium-binding protein SBP56-related protein [Longimicrobiales bacterium]
MSRMLPDPTFYASPTLAMEAPDEKLAYVALLTPENNGKKDALGVIDTDPASETYGQLIHQVEFPNGGNELHHFGWNACSSHLCPWAAHPHVERRYLVVPGTHSSRIHVLDTQPDPRRPRLVKVIEPEEVMEKTGYAFPHTVHCGPDGIYMNALGAPNGDGPGGIFMLDHDDFELKGAWEKERGPQHLAYDFYWHLGHDTMITSEWGTPNMVKDGVNAELLLAGEYGHALHVWDLKTRKHLKRIELGEKEQMVLELRPAHDPRKAYGFVGVVLSLEDLSASIFLWYLDETAGKGEGNGKAKGEWKAKKVITIPAEPADADQLPPVIRPFGAVPPLVTDINLSLDDRFLYVSCWGTGELRQYDVSDPFNPVFTGSARLGGIVGRTPHPSRPDTPVNGAPQMVEVSRDGKRVYVTNSLYSPWDAQFYPDGIKGWVAKLDVAEEGGMTLDPSFFTEIEEGLRPHQVRLEGGDASSDSFCFA